jgi:hypothetical protein
LSEHNSSGYQFEAWVGATGTAANVKDKEALIRAQLNYSIEKNKLQDVIDVLDVQTYIGNFTNFELPTEVKQVW